MQYNGTLLQEEKNLRLLKVWVTTWSIPDRFIMSIFAWRVWHGQYSPGFKFNKLKSFSRGKIDQNHVNKRILGGKGLQYEDSRSITFVLPVRYGAGVALTLSADIGQRKKTQKSHCVTAQVLHWH